MNEILNYEKVVISIASKFKKYYDIEDLYQVGMIGLIKARENYKDEYNTKFSSYAYMYILGEILKYINDNKPLKINKETILLNGRINKAKEIISQKIGREPTIKEISAYLEIDEKLVEKSINANMPVKSLDYVLNDNDDNNNDMYNYIGYYDAEINPDILDLKTEITKLTDEEKRILYYRYYQDYTQSEVGDIMNTNQVSISRNESKILRKLRDKLAA